MASELIPWDDDDGTHDLVVMLVPDVKVIWSVETLIQSLRPTNDLQSASISYVTTLS